MNSSRSQKLERLHLSGGVRNDHSHEETGSSVACNLLSTTQGNEELCHFHLDPNFILLLRDANVEHQLPRNLYDKSDSFKPCHPTQFHILPIDSGLIPGSAVHVGHRTGNRRDSIWDTMNPRTQSLQNGCPQGSTRAIDSSGRVSMHTPQSNKRCAAAASSARSAVNNLSSSSNWNCKRAANSLFDKYGAASVSWD